MEETKSKRGKILWSNFSGQFSNVLIFCAIIYFLIIVGRSMVNSYQDRQKLNERHAEIERLKIEVIYLENQNLYYKTVSYKEKEARKKLGFIKPGETVVALNRSNTPKTVQVASADAKKINEPNYIKWWNYFFSE